ncbi:hypothetical protein IG193_00485 [Infirmifilum lucidum]|uniref:Uncharacterized protein n=1 Tax=Infirmifilum lucidum TaxID=2776706 RepID=A0A7L9FGM5_9CREN|nr:hypothetical protein [Infirmifilum lucidum]QOJ78978.1 hypothetical protein IG193_00485 [Infirmifilum lucidum]
MGKEGLLWYAINFKIENIDQIIGELQDLLRRLEQPLEQGDIDRIMEKLGEPGGIKALLDDLSYMLSDIGSPELAVKPVSDLKKEVEYYIEHFKEEGVPPRLVENLEIKLQSWRRALNNRIRNNIFIYSNAIINRGRDETQLILGDGGAVTIWDPKGDLRGSVPGSPGPPTGEGPTIMPLPKFVPYVKFPGAVVVRARDRIYRAYEPFIVGRKGGSLVVRGLQRGMLLEEIFEAREAGYSEPELLDEKFPVVEVLSEVCSRRVSRLHGLVYYLGGSFYYVNLGGGGSTLYIRDSSVRLQGSNPQQSFHFRLEPGAVRVLLAGAEEVGLEVPGA